MNVYLCTHTDDLIKVELKDPFTSSFLTHEVVAESVEEATRKFLNDFYG